MTNPSRTSEEYFPKFSVGKTLILLTQRMLGWNTKLLLFLRLEDDSCASITFTRQQENHCLMQDMP